MTSSARFTTNTYTWSGLNVPPEAQDAVELTKSAAQRALDFIREHALLLENGDGAIRCYVGGSQPPLAAHGDFWWGGSQRLYRESTHGEVTRTNLFAAQAPTTVTSAFYTLNGDISLWNAATDAEATEIRYVMGPGGEWRAGFVVGGAAGQTRTFSFEYRSTQTSQLRAFHLRTSGAATDLDEYVVLDNAEQWQRVTRTITMAGSTATVWLTPEVDQRPDQGDVVFIKKIMVEAGSSSGSYFNGYDAACSWTGVAGNSPSTYTPAWLPVKNMEGLTSILQPGDYTDGFVDIFVGEAEPPFAEDGDLWDDGTALQRRTGMTWTPVASGGSLFEGIVDDKIIGVIDPINERIFDLEEAINSVVDPVFLDELQADLDQLEIDLSEANTALAQLGVDLSQLDIRIVDAEAILAGLPATLSQLDTDITEAEADLAQLTTDLTELSARVIDTETTLNQIPTTINILDGEIAAAQDALDTAFPGGAFDVNQAVDGALQAAATAANKKTAVRSSVAPADTSVLWIKLPEGAPYVHNGTDWLLITDQRIVDAATAAANAQTTATQAVTEAQRAYDAAISAAIAGGNLLADSDVEDGGTGWNLAANPTVMTAVTTTDARSGAWVIRLDATAGNRFPQNNLRPRVMNGDVIMMRGWFRVPDGQPDRPYNDLGFYVRQMDKAGSQVDAEVLYDTSLAPGPITPAMGWIKAQVYAHVDQANAEYVILHPWCRAGGILWVDDIEAYNVTESYAAIVAAQEALTAAGNAQTTADAAVVSANGKNKVTYTNVLAADKPGPAPSTAFGSGRTVNDVHRNRNVSTGEVYAEWLWSGSAWNAVNFGDQIVRSLDVGNLTAGTATVQTAVIQKLAVQIATVIQLNADRITTGQLTASQINTTNLAAALATVLELNANRITTGQLGAARINVTELAAAVATIIQLNADRIVSGTIDTARLNAQEIAAAVATVIELSASRITTGQLGADRINVNELAAAVATIIQLNADAIVAGTISTARLNAEEVAAAVGQFIQLSANQITAGSISAIVTISGLIRTAQTGARVEIDSTGLFGYNSINQQIFRINSGEVFVRGNIQAGLGNSTVGGITLKPDGTVLGEAVIELFGKGVSTEIPGQLYFETQVIPNRKPGGVSTQTRSLVLKGPRTSTGSSAFLTLGYSTSATNRGLMGLDAHDLTVDLQGVMDMRSVGEMKFYSQGGYNLGASGLLTIGGGKVSIDAGASVADPNDPQAIFSGPWVSIESNLGSLAGGVSLDSPVVWIRKNRLNFAGTESSPKFYIGTADSGAIIIRAAAGVGIALDADNANNRLLISLSGQLAHAPSYDNTTTTATNLNIASNGVFRRSTSLREHKLNIEDYSLDPETVLDLQPVTWVDRGAAEHLADWLSDGQTENSADVEGIHSQVGLIAEDVEALGIPGLVTRDNEGNLSGVAYERLSVVLLPLVAQLKERVDDLTSRLDAATLGE